MYTLYTYIKWKTFSIPYIVPLHNVQCGLLKNDPYTYTQSLMNEENGRVF